MKLRYIKRDGKQILQSYELYEPSDGTCMERYEWRDVPLCNEFTGEELMEQPE